jgi:hypothetical protein
MAASFLLCGESSLPYQIEMTPLTKSLTYTAVR